MAFAELPFLQNPKLVEQSHDRRKILLVMFYQSDEVRFLPLLSFVNVTALLILSVTGSSS